MRAIDNISLAGSHTTLAAANAAANAIPPAWPLASSVAVNPFLGQVSEDLSFVAARLRRVAGVSVMMPRAWYQDKIASGAISDTDLAAALHASPSAIRPADLAALKTRISKPAPPQPVLPNIADLAVGISGSNWPGLIADRFGAWAAGYFDEGQALWAAPHGQDAYGAWRAVATHDLTPEIAGLKGFAAFVARAPETAEAAIAMAAARLGLSVGGMETYFHQLLTTLAGWAQYARYRRWQAELMGKWDDTVIDLLAIRLVWELALLEQYGETIAVQWLRVAADHALPVTASDADVVDAILQEALERATQRDLAAILAAPSAARSDARPRLQVAFCIDVRSEVFRRSLESVHPEIRTLGFAGFFGLAASHRRFASDVDELRLPVLLNPTLTTQAGRPADQAADFAARIKARASRAWGRFKLAAVSSFAFVEATGPIYVSKLVRDALGLALRPAPDDPAPQFEPALDLATRTSMAESILRAMSMTDNFARLVVLAGHGANVVNNPFSSSLHCGACGGYSGEVNARLLAALFNDMSVRESLIRSGITLPIDTIFVAGLHDTTTDAMTLYDSDHLSPAHTADIAQARSWFLAAGTAARGERALRFPRAISKSGIVQRSRDWSEVRPEWGLAGCNAFVAAPRFRTAGKSLGGRAFLHDYDWRKDKSFGVLELIMTAPVVVASWISLQYYGSTVAPTLFGGGNKLLHNVTGGIGVVEGNGGILRAGLPWQSVHDGEKLAHEPLRLSVCIEAPREAISEILSRHHGVRSLFENRWLHLFAMSEQGQMAWRYAGNLEWSAE